MVSLQLELIENPAAGDVEPGTGGLRKIRLAAPARGKGKRGGARVHYLWLRPAPGSFRHGRQIGELRKVLHSSCSTSRRKSLASSSGCARIPAREVLARLAPRSAAWRLDRPPYSPSEVQVQKKLRSP